MMSDDKEDGEKLFSEKSTSQPPEAAKFIPDTETKNGVSPINVECIKSKFTGLTKEELLKYSKDPFWIRIRWTLFILFWIIWFIMLFGAIAVIIVTPKCKQADPPLWWQRSALYKTEVLTLPQKDGLVIDSLRRHIDHLKELGVETLVLKYVLNADLSAPLDVTNFTDVMPVLKSLDEFKTKIIDYAKEKDINVIIEFIPNSSSKNHVLFIRATSNETDFEDVYVWYPKNKEENTSNWKSVYGGSAWSKENNRYFLHQFLSNEPEFNFRNSRTLQLFNDTFLTWLNLGVKGFFLDRTEYLLEDANFEDEKVARNTSYTADQYGYYYHSNTFERPETTELLKNWSSIIKNQSGILGVSGGVGDDREIANFVFRPIFLPPNFNATQLNDDITRWKNSVDQPAWEWNCTKDVKQCFPEEAIDGLRIVSFLLPGTPVLKLGQEFGYDNVFHPNNNTINQELWQQVHANQSANPESHLNIVKELIKLREKPSITYGTFESTVLKNTNNSSSTVFAFTRIKSGNPGYLVAWNLGNESAVVNFDQFTTVPDDLIVVIKSGRVFGNQYPNKSRIFSSNVELPPKAAAVFSFVPKSQN